MSSFLSATTTTSPRGNNPLSTQLAADVADVLIRASGGSARSRQRHVGPSEIGHPCDRQVAGKLAGLADGMGSSGDPWPSIVGTAVHAWLAEAFTHVDARRWLTERSVTPIPGHSGTADLYDVDRMAVLDHKVMGASTLAKLTISGPSRVYLVQLLLYALGYMKAGFRVEHVGIVAYPRVGSSLSGIYVWTMPMDAAARDLLVQVMAELTRRKAYAAQLEARTLTLADVPATPDTCTFCPFHSTCGQATNVW